MQEAAVMKEEESQNAVVPTRYFYINRFCIEHGWQSRDFARLFVEFIGERIPERTIYRWISGTSKPRRSQLKRICQFLAKYGEVIKPFDLERHYDLAKDRRVK